ncbi:signal transduction histidine kinase/CheY-like chemotaxis protein [Sphingomonas sp. BE138]|uniref:ATP-binding protein n=1 Tax=Sphingomonas sp. BE138 TaxID=2817845 RepID=UPI00285BC28C|nr:ATP-binding protein [Sphingomonas sp. BE138]MDR6789417.1 signal transduction histidine kinase/CheY-like chemotaxis protein [Sphingomonas sp. BE138]
MTERDAPWRGLAGAWRTIALSVMAVAGAVVLALLVVTLAEVNAQRDRALASQRHSYDVMILARIVQGTVAHAEASLGRYVISGDQQLGQVYYDDWRRARQAIGRLAKLVHDNDVQLAHVAALQSAFQIRGTELARTALSTNYGQNSQALSRFYQVRQSDALTRINDSLDGIITDERLLLEMRTAQARASVRRSTTIAKVLAVFGVLLVGGAIAMGWIMVEALADRAIARAEAESERLRADELGAAVTRATDELRVQEARLRQVQKMEAVGQLTGGIAHDFNNMLAVVISGIELAARHLPPGAAESARHLDGARDGAERAAALTARLLAFARETAINPEPIAIATLFAGLEDMLTRTLGDGLTLALEDDSGGWCTRVDRVQLENTLLNLAVNARDAMAGRGTLTIRAAAASLPASESGPGGDALALAVTDTGCGIPPDVLERVFEPFFTTKPLGKGTGLGLSQTFAFARQVGGEVSIASQPGRGTTVTLLLPRDRGGEAAAPAVAVAAPAPPAAPPAPAPPAAAAPADAPLAILVVEDDPRVLSATLEALAELGHEARGCHDATQVTACLEAMPHVDLIVSDVLMPTLTGPEMVARLPAGFAHLPVLFVTGFAGESGGVDLGDRPVLRKPFTLAALDRAVLAAARPLDPTPLAAE